jgi:drug/metabolite transporter (DMT)-like permease
MESRKAEKPLTRSNWLSFCVIGIALFGGAATQQLGLLTTTVTNSSFITGLSVVFVPLIAVIFLRRQPHWIIWPAALTALSGIYLLSGGSFSRLTPGDLLTVVCAVFWSVQITLAGSSVRETGRPLSISATQFAVTTALALTVAVVTEPISIADIRGALGEILYLGIFSSGLAFALQVIGQRYTTAPQAAIILSSEALFGASLGALLLGETMGPLGYAGCALMFSAMLAVELVPELTRRRRVAA